jgi:hypothetical protein
MATAISEPIGNVRRPELLSKIDIEVNINDAILLATEDGLLTALDDRYRFSMITYAFFKINSEYLEHYVFG